MVTGEIRNGRLPSPYNADDLLQVGKAIHDNLWKKTEARIEQGVSEVKSLVQTMEERLGSEIDRTVGERVAKVVENTVRDSLGLLIRQYEEKSHVYQTKAMDLERRVGESLDLEMGNLERKHAEQLAAYAARAEFLEQRATLFETVTKELVAQMVEMVASIKNIQFAPPIISVNVPEQLAPQITIQAPEPAPITINVPEQPPAQITLQSPASRPMRKTIQYDEFNRPCVIDEREASE